MRTADTGIARPWHWLVEVARLCRLTGDTELLAEITLVVQFWDTQLRGRIGLGDAQDMMLSCPPPGVVVEVYSIALPALERIDPAHLVMRNATADLTIRVLLMLAALYVLEHPDGSSPEARSAAARIVATRGAGT
jgi:hypothetical protein